MAPSNSSSSDNLLPMNTMLHTIPIKLSSSNYLICQNQMIPLFTYQKLLDYVLGTTPHPSSTITDGDKTVPNPSFSSWIETDQKVLILLHSSLTEEVFAEILGLSTTHQI